MFENAVPRQPSRTKSKHLLLCYSNSAVRIHKTPITFASELGNIIFNNRIIAYSRPRQIISQSIHQNNVNSSTSNRKRCPQSGCLYGQISSYLSRWCVLALLSFSPLFSESFVEKALSFGDEESD